MRDAARVNGDGGNGRLLSDGEIDALARAVVEARRSPPTALALRDCGNLDALSERAVAVVGAIASPTHPTATRLGLIAIWTGEIDCSMDSAIGPQNVARVEALAARMLVPEKLTIGDVRNPPPEVCLLGRMIPLAKSSVLFGPGSVGKSAAIAQIATAIAAGAVSLWGLPLLSSGGPVLVYTAEDSLDDWKRKLGAIAHVGGVDVERALQRLFIVDRSEGVVRLVETVQVRTAAESRRMTRPTEEADAIIAAARHVAAKLIVFETASRMVDDEDNANMSALQSSLGRIARKTAAAVIASHHPTKAASKENDDAIESARGGGAFTLNARNGLTLYPVDKETEEARPYLGRFLPGDLVVLRHRKPTSSTRPEPPIVLVRVDGHHGAVLQRPDDVARSPDEDRAYNARLAIERDHEDDRLGRLYDVVAAALRLGKVSPSKLEDRATEIGIPRRGVSKFIETAIERDVLRSEPWGRGRGVSLTLGIDPRRKPVKSEE